MSLSLGLCSKCKLKNALNCTKARPGSKDHQLILSIEYELKMVLSIIETCTLLKDTLGLNNQDFQKLSNYIISPLFGENRCYRQFLTKKVTFKHAFRTAVSLERVLVFQNSYQLHELAYYIRKKENIPIHIQIFFQQCHEIFNRLQTGLVTENRPDLMQITIRGTVYQMYAESNSAFLVKEYGKIIQEAVRKSIESMENGLNIFANHHENPPTALHPMQNNDYILPHTEEQDINYNLIDHSQTTALLEN